MKRLKHSLNETDEVHPHITDNHTLHTENTTRLDRIDDQFFSHQAEIASDGLPSEAFHTFKPFEVPVWMQSYAFIDLPMEIGGGESHGTRDCVDAKPTSSIITFFTLPYSQLRPPPPLMALYSI
jgi:hypothetical protein